MILIIQYWLILALTNNIKIKIILRLKLFYRDKLYIIDICFRIKMLRQYLLLKYNYFFEEHKSSNYLIILRNYNVSHELLTKNLLRDIKNMQELQIPSLLQQLKTRSMITSSIQFINLQCLMLDEDITLGKKMSQSIL